MKRSLRLPIGLCFLLAVLHAATARGEDDDATRARTLFKEGRELAAAGRYVDATAKFEASLKLDRGMGTAFNLADSLEHSGREREAAKVFEGVANEAHDAGQFEREAAARARAKNLAKFVKHDPAAHEASNAGLPTPTPMVIPLVVDSKLRWRAKMWAELQAEYGLLADLDARVRAAHSEAKRLQVENPGDPDARAAVLRLASLRGAVETLWQHAGDLVARLGRGEAVPPPSPTAKSDESGGQTHGRLSFGSRP